MTVHITNINGMAINSVAQNAQNMVVDFAKQLGMNEFGIYVYHWKEEPLQARSTRFDGIIASLNGGDTVIFFFFFWIAIEWVLALINYFNFYSIFF